LTWISYTPSYRTPAGTGIGLAFAGGADGGRGRAAFPRRPGREPAARAELRAAHEKALQGQLGAAALHELQNRCIRDVIRFQEIRGLHAITDGEYGAARSTQIS